MATEIWTAREIKNENGKEIFVFDVQDKDSKVFLRQEEKNKDQMRIMMSSGGYPIAMGFLVLLLPLPWRFTKTDNGQIYLEGKSTGGDASYHPID